MQKRIHTSALVVSILAACLIIISMLGWLSPLRLVLDQIFNPIGRVVYSASRGVSDNFKFFGQIAQLNDKNESLESENLKLREQLSNFKEISSENDILRKQLGFNERQNLNLSAARVIAYGSDNIRKSLTIDKGSRAGLQKGMAVVSSGALIGTLDEVNDFSAKVFLLSDPDFRIRALGQDGRATGVVRGQIGSGYQMEKIAQSDVIKNDETIVTAGTDQVPKGIIIGQVETIERADNAIFQVANIKPALNLARLELAFVVVGVK